MPWIVGDAHSYRTCSGLGQECSLQEICSEVEQLSEPVYIGYLLDGFSEELALRRFRPERPPLAFKAGWNAVAVTISGDGQRWKQKFGPYLAPTSARPHGSVPLGLALFSYTWLSKTIEASFHDRHACLVWAAKLAGLITPESLIFCDPVLELRLDSLSDNEERNCYYRKPGVWGSSFQALRALSKTDRHCHG